MRRMQAGPERIEAMDGYIEQVGASFAVYWDGELAAIRPDRTSAEECLTKIYLFHVEEKQKSSFAQPEGKD
jgi:hypothetical protein